MPSVYPKRGKFYAPRWTCPGCGEVPAHPLGTMDRAIAVRLFTTEQAAHYAGRHDAGAVAQSVEQATFNRPVAGSMPAGPTPRARFSSLVDAYIDHKRESVKPATLAAYRGYKRQIIAQLGDPTLAELPQLLPQWVKDEVTRLDGRRNTVVKRLEAIIKPAIRLAYAQHGLGVPFVFPEIASDYRSVGVRTGFLSREQFAAMRSELPEIDTLDEMHGEDGERRVRTSGIVVYPRFWFDLGVTTGLHAIDLDLFTAAQWNRAARTWLRRNSKNDEHYRPEWLRCLPYQQRALSEHIDRFGMKEDDRLVAAGIAELPAQWMRRRLIWAAHRAGLCVVERKGKSLRIVKGWAPAPIDLRRTCAQWRRAEGWTFDLTAKWLANSSGIVAEVYAPTVSKEIDRAVQKSGRASAALIKLTRDLDGPRRSARAVQAAIASGSKSGSKLTTRTELTHGKQSIQGGGPTD